MTLRVPRIESSALGGMHSDWLQQKHRELLSYVKDDLPGTEAVAYYGLDLNELSKYKGAPGGFSVPSMQFDVPHIALHTHPDCLTFSAGDLDRFMLSDNMRLITAVGNDGSLYYMEKTAKFDFVEAYRDYRYAIDMSPDYKDSPEKYSEFIDSYLTSQGNVGIIYGKLR